MPVRRLQSRVKTAANLGFDRFAGPSGEEAAGLPNYLASKDLKTAIKQLFV
jgi:predicted ATP-dependent serine protease